MKPHTLQERFLNPSLRGQTLTEVELQEERAQLGEVAGQQIEASWRSDDGSTTRLRLASWCYIEVVTEGSE